MMLVNRVSAFFLIALGVSLLGLSLSTFWLIQHHLYGELDGQLHNALHVLVAALEAEPDAVKWQPSDHTIRLGRENEAQEVRWVLVDELNRPIDRSANLNAASDAEAEVMEFARSDEARAGATTSQGHWRFLQQALEAADPKPAAERDPDEFPRVRVTVALSTERLEADLWKLGLLTFLLPAIFWIVAALVGRAYCRHALIPLGEMAAKARSMQLTDFSLRVPAPLQQDELRDMAEAFNGLLDKLEQAYGRQQRFAGDAAHQLKTPLTALRGQIDVALLRPRSAGEYVDLLGRLGRQTYELQRIVESLLLLARHENDGAFSDKQTVCLATWLSEYSVAWQSHPRADDLHWNLQEGVELTTSPALLRQAVDNLIDNAIKYSPPDSAIDICCRQTDSHVHLSVQDHGTGIEPREQECIFDPFYRSPTARQRGVSGLGLGLALVARIVRALGGQITCSSQLDHGARFDMAFPIDSIRSTPSPLRVAN